MRPCNIVALMVLSLLLSACMAGKNGTTVATDRASNEWRLKTLEASFLDFREKQRAAADADTMNRKKLDDKLKALEAKVAALETGKAAATATASDKRKMPPGEGWVTDLKPGVDGWTSVKPKAKAAPKPVQKAAVKSKPVMKPKRKVVKAKPKPRKKVVPKKRVVKGTGGAQDLYDKGLALYRTSDFDAARKIFDAYLAKYPKTKLAANALYWKGETYYTQKQYAQAILTFKDVSRRYAKSPKAPAALLKTGMAYEMAGDGDNAVFYLRALIEDYPKSGAATIARQRLANLGG